MSGKCDPSLVGSLSIVVGQPDTTAVLVPCANDKTFETQIDVSDVTYNPATITVTQGTGPNAPVEFRTVDNEILIPLAIDPDQSNLTEANKSAYRVQGACDASEYGSDITVKIGNPETAETPTTCHTSSNTFDVEINASGVVSNTVTIRVTHGTSLNTIQATRSVANNVLAPLSIDSSQPDLDDSNKAAYTVRGTCNSSAASIVSVVIGLPDTTAVTAPCSSTDNTFSAAVNASGVLSSPATITVTHNGDHISETVANNITILLSIDSSQPAPR